MQSFLRPFLFLISLVFSFTIHAQVDSAKWALEGMCSTFLNLKTIQIKQITIERVDGQLNPSIAEAKVQFKPTRKIYIRSLDQNNEITSELLFLEGENNNDALVNPVSFPYINLDLDPKGHLMRKGRHHTIFEAGGKYLAEVIHTSMAHAESVNEFKKRFRFVGTEIYQEKKCYRIEIVNNDYALDDYTVKADEDVIDIARKKMIPEYKILETNAELDDYDEVEEGDEIKIPRYYGKKIVLLIDAKTFIPWYQRIEDEQGVFAEYKMLKCYLNPEFSEIQFSSENPAYGF